MLWYAFPALPIAAWTLWDGARRGNRLATDPAIQMPLVLAGATLTVLGVAADGRELYLMPSLLPLSVLAAAGTDDIPRTVAMGLARLGKWSLGLLALALWIGYAALIGGMPDGLAEALAEYQPGFIPQFSWPQVALASIATIALVGVMWPRASTGERGVLQWTAGVTLCGALLGTLWLPYLDAGKSYRDMIASMQESLPVSNCVASRNLGEPQRALLHYYARLTTVRVDKLHDVPCDVLLVQGGRTTGAPARSRDWISIWKGARAGDKRELYQLYIRGVPKDDPLAHRPRNVAIPPSEHIDLISHHSATPDDATLAGD